MYVCMYVYEIRNGSGFGDWTVDCGLWAVSCELWMDGETESLIKR